MPAQQLDEALAVRCPPETGQAFQHRQIRLACAEVFETLARRHPEAAATATLRNALTIVVFPIPGSPVTNTTCRSPTSARSSHSFMRASSDSRPRRWLRARPALVNSGAAVGVMPGCGLLRNSTDETVAAPMRGLDEPRRLGVVAKRLAQLPDAVLQNGIGDERSRPHGVEQLLLRHELPGVFDQMREHRKSFGPERDLLQAPPELAFLVSRRNPPKVTSWPCCITKTSPQHDRRVMTAGCRARYSRLAMKALQPKNGEHGADGLPRHSFHSHAPARRRQT